MSRKARTRNAEKRKKEKAARKSAQKLRYAAYRDSGNNSKRAARNKKKEIVVKTHAHLTSNCGNIGCNMCNKISFKSFLAEENLVNMPHWIWKESKL